MTDYYLSLQLALADIKEQGTSVNDLLDLEPENDDDLDALMYELAEIERDRDIDCSNMEL